MAPLPLSGMEVIQQPLPALKIHEVHRTTSKSTQKPIFLANLAQWDLEQEARQFSKSIDWSNDIQVDECDKERLWCGGESSVVGRFNQNLSHFLTPIIHRYIEEDVGFGDYYCVEANPASPFVPDITPFDKENRLCLVGEVKTPWMHKIGHEQRSIMLFRKLIGKIEQNL